jgi:hypothetical protein
MTNPLKPYRVFMHRQGRNTKGRIDVQALNQDGAERMARDQVIAVSYPNSKRSQWIVTGVEVLE